ncbi:MAG: gamma-glutamyltransferase family protein, partial [Rhodospirillales bacterium]|nr:gamma-glutamyltransferase family protein [Rhodospirillales bacterium]
KLARSIDANRHIPAASLKPPPVERLENPSATSFVVVDRFGQTVACNLSMNNLFGTGRFASGTGVLLAALPGPAGRGPTSLGPMIVVNPFRNDVFFAAAASGGVTAPTSLVNVAARTLLTEESLEQAMLAKRVHHEGVPDIAFFENGIAEAVQKSLLSRGHRLARTPALGRVNAVYCSEGLIGDSGSCSMRADTPPRGYGLAAGAD